MTRALFITIITSMLLTACVNDDNTRLPDIVYVNNCECSDKETDNSDECNCDNDCNDDNGCNCGNTDTDDGTAKDDNENKDDGNDDGNNDDVFTPPTPIYEYVDLGLSVKWGTCDIGEDYNRANELGERFYSWGANEALGKSEFKVGNHWEEHYNKYNEFDEKTILEPGDDIATIRLGENWRTPTFEEWQELFDNCTWEWTCIYPHEMYPDGQDPINSYHHYTAADSARCFKITGKNGNHIYLLANNTYDNRKRNICHYWTSQIFGYTGEDSQCHYRYDYGAYIVANQVISQSLNENWTYFGRAEKERTGDNFAVYIRPVYDDRK